MSWNKTFKAKTLSTYPPINRLNSLNQHLFSSVFNRCNIPNLPTVILSISEKEFEEVIPPFEVLVFLSVHGTKRTFYLRDVMQ